MMEAGRKTERKEGGKVEKQVTERQGETWSVFHLPEEELTLAILSRAVFD